jgi:hypothetical protein
MGTRLRSSGNNSGNLARKCLAQAQCGPPGRVRCQIRWSSVTQSSDLLPIWGLNCGLTHPTPNTRRCAMSPYAGYARAMGLSSMQI